MDRVAVWNAQLSITTVTRGLATHADPPLVEVRVCPTSGMGVLLMRPYVSNSSNALHSAGSLCGPVRLGIWKGLKQLEACNRCSFIVLASASQHVFSLGIDTFCFEEGLPTEEEAKELKRGSVAAGTFSRDESSFSSKRPPSVQELCEAVVKCSKPSVAVLLGKCFSWGMELALCCTFRIGVEGHTWISFPEGRLATLPASVIGLQALARRAGVWMALRLLCAAPVVAAADAKQAGLLDKLISYPCLNQVKNNQGKVSREEMEDVAIELAYSLSLPQWKELLNEVCTFMESQLQQAPSSASMATPGVKAANAGSLDMKRAPYPDPVTQVLIPFHSKALSLSFLDQSQMWCEVRMYCAWAAHQISESRLPRTVKAPYFLIECVRIATIRFAPSRYHDQLARFLSFCRECLALKESRAVQHTYQCVRRQLGEGPSPRRPPVPQVFESTEQELARRAAMLLSHTKEVSEGDFYSATVSIPASLPVPRPQQIAIVAEDMGRAAFLAAVLLHGLPQLSIVMLCLRPFRNQADGLRLFDADEEDSSNSKCPLSSLSHSPFRSQGRFFIVDQNVRRSNKETYQTLQDIRRAVMYYMWLFRSATNPEPNATTAQRGVNAPSSSTWQNRFNKQLNTRLRMIDVPFDHSNNSWQNVPSYFYQSDYLFECSYPWGAHSSSTSLPTNKAMGDSERRAATLQAAIHGCRRNRWAYLDACMREDCVFVTTTVTTDLNLLTRRAIVRHKHRLVGIFFAPRIENGTGVAEICMSTYTSPEVVHEVRRLVQRLSTYAVVVRTPVCGAALCRLFFSGLYQAHSMLVDGCFPIELDRAMRRRFHSKLGLLALEDLWGIDWCTAVRHSIGTSTLPTKNVTHVVDRELIAKKHVGRGSGLGWFSYGPPTCTYTVLEKPRLVTPKRWYCGAGGTCIGKTASSPSPAVLTIPLYAWPPKKVYHHRQIELGYIAYCREQKILRRDVTELEMTERMCLAMLDTGVRLLADGVVKSSKEIDLLSIYGLGFPSWTGGLIFDTDQKGDPKEVSARLMIYNSALRDESFPSPCRAISEMAASKRSIGETFP